MNRSLNLRCTRHSTFAFLSLIQEHSYSVNRFLIYFRVETTMNIVIDWSVNRSCTLSQILKDRTNVDSVDSCNRTRDSVFRAMRAIPTEFISNIKMILGWRADLKVGLITCRINVYSDDDTGLRQTASNETRHKTCDADVSRTCRAMMMFLETFFITCTGTSSHHMRE